MSGVNVKVMSERLGHSSAKMTLDVYTRALPTLQRQAASTMEAIVCRHDTKWLGAPLRESPIEMAKKPTKNPRKRSQLDDPKGARRSMDAEMSYARREAKGRIETTKYRAELDPKTGRKRR